MKSNCFTTALLLLGLLVAGCAKVQPPPPVVSVPVQPPAKPAVKVSRFTLMAQRIAGTTNLPATVRTIDPFLKLPKDTSLSGLFLAVGPPDNELGSGFWYYTYRLHDGSTLHVASNDNVTIREVTHVKADFSITFIIDNRQKLYTPDIGSDLKAAPQQKP